jgi:hypothetical protein
VLDLVVVPLDKATSYNGIPPNHVLVRPPETVLWWWGTLCSDPIGGYTEEERHKSKVVPRKANLLWLWNGLGVDVVLASRDVGRA